MGDIRHSTDSLRFFKLSKLILLKWFSFAKKQAERIQFAQSQFAQSKILPVKQTSYQMPVYSAILVGTLSPHPRRAFGVIGSLHSQHGFAMKETTGAAQHSVFADKSFMF